MGNAMAMAMRARAWAGQARQGRGTRAQGHKGTMRASGSGWWSKDQKKMETPRLAKKQWQQQQQAVV